MDKGAPSGMINHPKQKEVLYLSYDGMTDPLGQSQVLPYLTQLSKEGYRYTIISFEKKQLYHQESNQIRNITEQAGIQWLPLCYHKNPPILSTIADLWQLRRKCKALFESTTFDLIHCRSYPTMLIGMYLKRRYGAKLLFDMRGFWADERVDGKLWNLKNPLFWWIYQYFKRQEVNMSTQADHIISLTHEGKKELVSGGLFKNANVNIEAGKITVVPCATDYDLFNDKNISPEQIIEKKHSLGLQKNDKILIYLGSLGTWYLLYEMVDLFKHYSTTTPNVKFLIITRDDPSIVSEAIQTKGIDQDTVIVQSAQRTEIPLLLKMADLGVFFIRPAYSKKASSATKLGEMLAMELPVVLNANVGDHGMLMEQYKCGVSMDVDAEDWIKELPPWQEVCRPYQTDGFSKSREYFDLKTGVSKYKEVYKQLTNPEN